MNILSRALLLGLFLHSSNVLAGDFFVAREKANFLRLDGDCDEAQTPQSTFKIPIALMGFEAKVLLSESLPKFTFDPKKHVAGINVCKGDHTPKEWMRDSCVWVSQEITARLGLEKFQAFVTAFGYGNKDLSGPDALKTSWLNSTLKITPVQQLEFLQRLLDGQLPVSSKSLELTRKILHLQELPGGWQLYGKTGNGRSAQGLQHGWFVGWIEKNDRRILFAQLLVDKAPEKTYASFRAKNQVLLKLWDVIEELEK
ncbi:MAG: penicillin-binding transpeptidase domain-containing protein [Bacteriovoracia bacterium]